MADFAMPISKWATMTEDEALDTDWDEIPTLSSHQKTLDFCDDLEHRRKELELLISRHLGISPRDFVLSDRRDWIWGSFNVCLIVDIKRRISKNGSTLPEQAILRLPLPHRSGEDYSPSNVDEKIRCEAATYIWLGRSCPSIRTPRLLGIGVPGTQSFTPIENESLWNRLLWQFRRCWAWLQGDTLAPYFAHKRDTGLSHVGYLLLEFILDGESLSFTWQKHRHDDKRRSNLYHGLTKILLDLAKTPLPRIGSWTMDNRGVISLSNRPFIDLTMLWNRHAISTNIPRNLTYTLSVSYVLDLISYQDTRMRYQPNAILGLSDGVYQLAALSALRMLTPKLWNSHTRNGPFVLTLIDLHQGNIMVDEDWNVVGVIDLEFAPVQPAEMTIVPTWLTDQSVEDLTGPALTEYQQYYDQFVDILAEQETATNQDHSMSERFREDWRTGKPWYISALRMSNGFPFIFDRHIRRRVFGEDFDYAVEGRALACLWDENYEKFVEEKLKDKDKYEQDVRDIFAAARARAGKDQPSSPSQPCVTEKSEESLVS